MNTLSDLNLVLKNKPIFACMFQNPYYNAAVLIRQKRYHESVSCSELCGDQINFIFMELLL